MSGDQIGEIVHIAGCDIRVGDHLRQRCGWCGAVLIDYDLTRVATIVEYDEAGQPKPWEGPATWPVGALVAVDGGTSWTVDHEDGAKLPDTACGQLPYELTGREAT